jgi:hypothetical protein
MVWRSQIGEDHHTQTCYVILGKIARKELSSIMDITKAWSEARDNRGEKGVG